MKSIYLRENWKLQSSEKINSDGLDISKVSFETDSWFNAEVPSTIMQTLVNNGVHSDPYFGMNLKEISEEPFLKSWWYRKEFDLTDEEIERYITLFFDGVNYKANVWLNGVLIADKDEIYGTYRQFQVGIGANVNSGANALAIEVFKPILGEFSIGFVDWNPPPPDQNMGIFRDVRIEFCDDVSIDIPFVETKVNLETLEEASLSVTAELVNHSKKAISGILNCKIENIEISKSVQLNPKERRTIELSSSDYSQLIISEPRLWWPSNMGDANLYELNLSFSVDEKISDKKNITFGIREVEDYVNEGGHKGFKINGRKVLIKGAGWSDDLLLGDTHESLTAQIEYVKHMNLNCIRLEGFWGKDHKIYDLCDQYGILIMVGWSCHWEHAEYLGKPIDVRYGGVIEPDEIKLIAESWEDQILWLRNHPSIFVWTVGSDMVPHPDLERKYVESFNKYDTTRPYLNSTGGVGSEQGIITSTEIISEISGSSRVKMLGPYAYTPPIYWFTNQHLGGAYGFNTETCPGANVPPIDSIRKMIPEKDLWPINDVWEFHCGKNYFSKLDRIQKAISERYGESSDVEDFAKKAQLLNYELMRPMFEAFQANKVNATGIIQWMLNSAFPQMYWQLYDSYLNPNGAFYGARKACEPVHLLYNYGDDSIYIINDTLKKVETYIALIQIYDINSKEILNKRVELNSEAESSTQVLKLPELKDISTTYFLSLKLYDESSREIGDNFYWLSTQKDVLDYEAEVGEWAFYTPSKQYADFNELNLLPEVEVNINHSFEVAGEKQKVNVVLENTSNTIAFFIELNIHDEESGEKILPIIWSDNYISLLPDEKKEIEGTYNSKNKIPKLNIIGWNLKTNSKGE